MTDFKPRPPARRFLPSRRVLELELPRRAASTATSATNAAGQDTRVKLTVSVIFGFLVRVALAVFLLYLLWRARVVIVTILAAALVAVTAAPLVDRLAEPQWLGLPRRLRRSLAAFLVFVVFALLVFYGFRFFITPFFRDLAELVRTLSSDIRHWDVYYNRAQEWVNGLPEEVRGLLQTQIPGNLSTNGVKFLQRFVVSGAHWVGYVVELVLIPILAFYFIVEERAIRREWIGLLPRRHRRDAVIIAREAARIMRNYIGANLMLCVIAGVVTWVVLTVLGVPYALSLSVLAGLTRFVPIIGPLLGGIPIVLVAAAKSPAVGLTVLTLFTLLHLAESKLLLPRMVGRSLDISGALVLIALLLGAEFGGLVGVFVAAPFAALVRVLILMYTERRRRIRVQMALRAPREPSFSGRRA